MTRAHAIGSVAALAALLASGCWVDTSDIRDAIWSDDDQMLAIVVHSGQYRGEDYEDVLFDTRDLGSELFVLPADLSTPPEPILEPGQDFGDLYLMSAAGYLVVETLHDSEVTRTWQYFLETGEARVIADSDDWPDLAPDRGSRRIQSTPSPDGTLIAIQQVDASWDHSRSTIAIVDAYSAKEVFPRVEVPGGRHVWTPDGELVAWSSGPNAEALRWTRDSGVLQPTRAPGCRRPETTSGPVAEDGRYVEAGPSLDEPVRMLDAPPDSPSPPPVPFGCP